MTLLIALKQEWTEYWESNPARRLYYPLCVVTAILIVSVALNVLLAYRVRSQTSARRGNLLTHLLKPGTAVPPITARRLGGPKELISYKGTDQLTVLYVFTPPCSWCARNMESFNTLVNQKSAQYRFIGVSLSEEGLSDYVAKNDLKLPVYTGLSTETQAAYKLGSTPQTIVISSEGRVLQNWMGAYVGDQKSQVEAFFHVSLPGVRELPKAEAAKN